MVVAVAVGDTAAEMQPVAGQRFDARMRGRSAALLDLQSAPVDLSRSCSRLSCFELDMNN